MHSTAGHIKQFRPSHTEKKNQVVTDNSLYMKSFPSKPLLFYRNQRDVGVFKHYCISRYIQESALLSCFTACALWHRSELLKALPCPLSGPLHVWYPLPRQFLSLQFTSPSQKRERESLQLLLKISSRMFKAFDSVLLSKTHFVGEKIFTVAIDSCTGHEKSSSLSVKITPIF